MLSEGYKVRQMRRIWNEVVTDNPKKDEAWQRKTTLEIFNTTYKDHADNSDLDDALENVGDYR